MPSRSAASGWLLSLAVLGLALPAQAASGALYANARFGYTVQYPADLLVPEREADNADGRQFHAREGSARLAVWGAYNAESLSPRELAARDMTDCAGGTVSYRVAKARLIAFSCITPGGQVIYQKTLIRADVLATVRFDYPLAERARWDPVVGRVASSLSLN